MSDKSVDGNTAHASTGRVISPSGPAPTSHSGSNTRVGESALVTSEPQATATRGDSTTTTTGKTDNFVHGSNPNPDHTDAGSGYANYAVASSVPGIPGQDKVYNNSNYQQASGGYNGHKKSYPYQGQGQVQGNKHQNQYQNYQHQHQHHQNQHGAPSGPLSPGNGANSAPALASPSAGLPGAGASTGGTANASTANNKIRRSYKPNNYQPNNFYYPPQNMYQYGYVPAPYGGYPVIPSMAIPNYAVPIQNPYAPIPGSKVTLTTKDGKPVDLEDKKKKTAANTPTSSPALRVVSPVQANALAAPVVAAPASPVAAAPAPNSAAEEFKRKILEKAAASKRAGEDQKAKEKAAKDKSEKDKAEKERLEKVKLQEEQNKAEQDEKDKIQAEKEQQEKERLEQEKADAEAEQKAKADAEAKITQAAEAQEAAKNFEAEAEAAVADAEATALAASAAVASEGLDEVASVEAASVETPVLVSSEEHPEDADASVTEETDAPAEEEEEAESSFTISAFLSKVKKAQEIDDIFEVKYPQDIVAADSSKKIPNKKYRYDPQFLIQFRSILLFPIDAEFKAQLEKVDIQTSKKGGSASGGQRSMSKFGNSLPGRFNGQVPGRGPSFNDPRQNSRSGSKRRGGGSGGGSSRDKSTRKSNQSKRGGREYREEEQVQQKPLEDVKPLEKSENRWVPRSRVKKVEVRYAEDGSELLEEEDVERKVKSLLNKLTLEMFTQITDDVLKIAAQAKWESDAKTIKQVISLTFAKACDEPYWSEMYAKFCAKLCTDIPNEVKDETITLSDASHPSGGSLARRILLTTCQTEYEKGWTDKLPTNEDGSPIEPEMMSDEYYTMAAAKRRGLGLVKFIGHLYNLGMLNDHVIFVCLRDQCKNTVDPSEDSLENLAQLVKTVGPKLDTDDRRKAILKIVFESIQKILDNVKLSSRIMFMLMDLQDLRSKKWKSDKSEAGPKTIEEIHRDAEIKRMEDARASNDRRQKRHHDQGRSNSSRSNSNWNSGLNSNSNSNSNSGSGGYLSNLKKSPSFANQNNQYSNSSNDSNLNRDSSKRSESTQVNRFAALGADDDTHE